jgi:hypothetical protein
VTPITQRLVGIEARADHAAGIRSDDFGHSVSEMQAWCEQELGSICSTDIPALIGAIREMAGALEAFADFPNPNPPERVCWPMNIVMREARLALEKAGKILGER